MALSIPITVFGGYQVVRFQPTQVAPASPVTASLPDVGLKTALLPSVPIAEKTPEPSSSRTNTTPDESSGSQDTATPAPSDFSSQPSEPVKSNLVVILSKTFDSPDDFSYNSEEVEFGTSIKLKEQEYKSDTSTVVLWHFNDTTDDSGPNKLTPQAANVAFANGRIKKAVEIKSPDGTLSFADNAVFAQVKTLEAWVFLRSSNSANYLFNKAKSYIISTRANDPLLDFQIWLSGTQSPTTLTSQTALKLNQWQHVGFIYDGQKMSIYIDGSLDAEKDLTGTLNGDKQPFFVGARDATSGFFDGLIDEARLSNQKRTDFLLKKYPTAPDFVENKTALNQAKVLKWRDLKEDADKIGGGEIYYQISFDNGKTWLFSGESSLTNCTSKGETAAVIRNKISTISLPSSIDWKIRACLSSQGEEQVILKKIEIELEAGDSNVASNQVLGAQSKKPSLIKTIFNKIKDWFK